MNRVVVTGAGVISPLGHSLEALWSALINGESGVDLITLFDTSQFTTRFAAEVKHFDPLNYMERKEARRMDRFCQFAVAAAVQAVKASGLKLEGETAEGTGVIIGSGIGGIGTLLEQYRVLLEKGPDRVSPFLATMMIPDIGAGQISILLGAKGPNLCTVSSCSSGADAIGVACETIRRGDAVAMIAGGSEATINALAFAAFAATRALSTRNDNPQGACRPFDRERDGLVMGEGAGVLVLESRDQALRRGAPILAEMVGYGATSDAYHVTQPSEGGEGGARAIVKALRQAGVAPSQIDYINAHGTSTPLNDLNETLAIKKALGPQAYRIPISSTKSMLGHLLGAAGAIEALISILTIKNGIIPPTINLNTPDPECDLDYVPNRARQGVVRTAMSNAFGFGGHNSVLIFHSAEAEG